MLCVYRELLLDVLPVVPNAAVIPVVVDCVRAGIVSVPRAIVMLNAMILNVPATPEAAMAIMVRLIHHTAVHSLFTRPRLGIYMFYIATHAAYDWGG